MHTVNQSEHRHETLSTPDVQLNSSTLEQGFWNIIKIIKLKSKRKYESSEMKLVVDEGGGVIVKIAAMGQSSIDGPCAHSRDALPQHGEKNRCWRLMARGSLIFKLSQQVSNFHQFKIRFVLAVYCWLCRMFLNFPPCWTSAGPTGLYHARGVDYLVINWETQVETNSVQCC